MPIQKTSLSMCRNETTETSTRLDCVISYPKKYFSSAGLKMNKESVEISSWKGVLIEVSTRNNNGKITILS